ncbi:hypothetical protein [[Clostridium] innocuum]
MNLKLLPYFSKLRMCDIKATHIRKWQNDLMAYRDQNNYDVKYHGLS